MANTFRTKYRELSPAEKQALEDLKTAAEVLESHIDASGQSRFASLAKTKLEESVMWAVKGVTG